MELDPVILSRIRFGFVISFHIIFPAFTMGLAAWLATIEGMRLFTGDPLYRRVFEMSQPPRGLSASMTLEKRSTERVSRGKAGARRLPTRFGIGKEPQDG